MMNKIAVLGANPALQKTLFFKEFRYGEVNRARRLESFPSGKGINFCRAAASWGRAAGVLFQFSGGENGKFVTDGITAEGMDFFNTPISGNTRCCTTCLDEKNRVMTELIEPSVAATPAEAASLLADFKRELPAVNAAAICGTLPDGTDYALYHQIAAEAHRAGKIILFDAWKNLTPCLNEGRNILKINREELAGLTGCADLRTALCDLFRKYVLEFAAITDGAKTAFASDGRNLFVYDIPQVADVVNPIGCGDTASAVMLSEISCGTGFAQAFHLALAAASANCLTSMPGSFDRETAQAFAAASSYRCETL